ncbi:MAG: hypothetical protein OEU90_02075 [Gammaproteobacteria bacterium]|nr:hypothetical protein [Gammaproteobacteria bacterium]MDH3804238.1 hypothetical protein [Gammaproteobacteria bacterium]
MNHRVARLLFGFGVGLIVAVLAFKWITNPAPRAERRLEETVVLAARHNLQVALSFGDVEVVDPLAPNRKIGKSYVYRAGDGWEVSGYYRRGEGDRWHPFLMSLDDSRKLVHIKVQDGSLVERATTDPLLEVVP